MHLKQLISTAFFGFPSLSSFAIDPCNRVGYSSPGGPCDARPSVPALGQPLRGHACQPRRLQRSASSQDSFYSLNLGFFTSLVIGLGRHSYFTVLLNILMLG